MRNKRKVGVFDIENDATLVSPIDNESELLAKKLIWAWMQDPSLALVLRKAFEIFPSTDIAEPVFEAIFKRSSAGDNDDLIISATADYLLADLFRSCIDFHGYFQRIDYPATSNPDALLTLASRYALKALAHENLPIFIQRQALLLLAVMQKQVTIINREETIQHTLHSILSGLPIYLNRQRMALYEVAAQITNDFDAIAALLVEHIKNTNEHSKEKILDEFAKRGGPFWDSLWKQIKKGKADNILVEDYKWASPIIRGTPSPIKQNLSKVIASNKNGFVHETALVKLALALVSEVDSSIFGAGISPKNISISQTQKNRVDWDQIWKPHVAIRCELKVIESNDPRFMIPSWIIDNPDARAIYWIGMILRSAVVGTTDCTGNRWKKSKTYGYKGLRTGWFKRRMGMMHAPEALVGDYATLSDWASELIMACLQWPGFESTHLQNNDIESITDIESLKYILMNRLKLLDSLYCKASDMPALITKVNRPKAEMKTAFRLVTVQQLLPKTTDFTVSDPMLDNPVIKSLNRDHLARICQLTLKTLRTKLKADGESRSCADLIVFPEAAIHPDDQDLLKRLADKTQSIILAGLVFKDHEGKLVNTARWLIPDYRESGRQWVIRDQGKKYLTSVEKKLGISPYRPCQHLIELEGLSDDSFILTGSICYDATDLKLASDLKYKSDLYLVLAHNKDVTTFDTMASALHYHMYQHVALVNKGEFGGSTIQAPYLEQYDRLISHAHGNDQISINVADLDLAAFNREKGKKYKAVKTKPAGN